MDRDGRAGRGSRVRVRTGRRADRVLSAAVLLCVLLPAATALAVEAPVRRVRELVSTLEYRPRFIAGNLKDRPDTVICFELGALDQARREFWSSYWKVEPAWRQVPGLDSRVGELVSYTESAMHYCYGDEAVIDPDSAARVPKGDRGALRGTLTRIESLAAEIKRAIDRPRTVSLAPGN